jgi:hypothetical protein
MIYKLYAADSLNLLSSPETGMGYQIINASEYGKTQIKNYIVYNSELVVDIDSDFQSNKRKIITEGFKTILNKSSQLILETKSIKVYGQSAVREQKVLSLNNKVNKKRHSGGNGAIDNPKEYANGTDYYVRLSAYEDDKRIDFQNKKLKPGSYTTTFLDYNDCVSTNDDPVDRYALPNDEKIKWAFFIKPKSYDTLQKGIVQPAFDHEGGGIEAYFENGTSNETYLLKKEYGK